MRKVFLAILAAFFVLGVGQTIVVDQAGREVLVPEKPERIASAFGVATAYLYALIGGEKIVAARYLGIPDHPLSQAVMSRLDPHYQSKALGAEITAEELVAKDVDLVFAGLKHKDLAKLLEELKIPCVLIGPETFEAVQEATVLIGRSVGEEERAQKLVAFYQEVLDAVANATREISLEERPKVLVVGTSALRVASGAMYQSRMVELAGGISVTANLPGSWQNVNVEQILLWNPDVIIIVPYSPVEPQEILQDPILATVSAVQSGRVYKMPQLLFAWDTPIPESVLGILWIAELFHPGRVPLDFPELLRTFYAEFYQCTLSEHEISELLGR